MTTENSGESKKERISVKELMADKSDGSTYVGRVAHFIKVTDVKNFFVTNAKLNECIALVNRYQAMQTAFKAGEVDKEYVDITAQEKQEVEEAIDIRNSAVIGESGEIIPRAGRMCGFLPFNVPILMGVLLLPPTMKYTIMMQWLNQTYMAGLNYANKNPSATYSN